MKISIVVATAACMLATQAHRVFALPRDRSTIDEAIGVLGDWAKAPETTVPPALLRDAHAVVIVPNQVKGGFLAAGRFGRGVVLIRQGDGTWSAPVFVRVGGGSFGLQVGVQATDLFLVIKNAKSLDRILRGEGKLTLGADISVAAGPVGRQASANTDAQMKAEILSYSRSRGVFGGVAIEGDVIRVDGDANDRFYDRRGSTVPEILGGKLAAPQSAATLRAAVAVLEGMQPAPATLESPALSGR